MQQASTSMSRRHLQRSSTSDKRMCYRVAENNSYQSLDTIRYFSECGSSSTVDKNISQNPLNGAKQSLVDNMDLDMGCSDMDQVGAMDLMPVWGQDFEKCRQQIVIKFGCIPPIQIYLGPPVV